MRACYSQRTPECVSKFNVDNILNGFDAGNNTIAVTCTMCFTCDCLTKLWCMPSSLDPRARE